MTLLELWEEDGPTQKQLVKKLDVEQATMANTLTRMTRDCLITRKPHASDGRARIIFLTEKTRRLKQPALDAAMAQNEQALSPLSDDERGLFIDMMRRVIGAMKSG